MKDRYSKLKTGLISATTSWSSHCLSLPLIESQYCHCPVSTTEADTTSSCRIKVPLSKSNKCNSASSLASSSPPRGGLFDGGAEAGSAPFVLLVAAGPDFFDEMTPFS